MTVAPGPRKSLRPLWVVLGLLGACAACCAVPIAALVIGGASLAGLGMALSQSWDMIVCGWLMLIILIASLAWMRPRRAAQSCSADGACGCKEKA